jgi:hypothetical protein
MRRGDKKVLYSILIIAGGLGLFGCSDTNQEGESIEAAFASKNSDEQDSSDPQIAIASPTESTPPLDLAIV